MSVTIEQHPDNTFTVNLGTIKFGKGFGWDKPTADEVKFAMLATGIESHDILWHKASARIKHLQDTFTDPLDCPSDNRH